MRRVPVRPNDPNVSCLANNPSPEFGIDLIFTGWGTSRANSEVQHTMKTGQGYDVTDTQVSSLP